MPMDSPAPARATEGVRGRQPAARQTKPAMKNQIEILLVMLGIVAAGGVTPAATFVDDFSIGLDTSFWSVSQTTPGLYSMDTTHGAVGLGKIPTQHNPGGLQNVQITLNMARLGGSIAGDFSTQILFTNASLGGALWDQVEFHTFFADGTIFYDVYDNGGGLNVHVWNNATNGRLGVGANSGTFGIARSGSTLSGTFNGSPLFSEINTAALTGISFVLQNNNGSDDTIAATYDAFSLSAPSLRVQPVLNGASLAETNLVLMGSYGLSGASYRTLMSTNVAQPLSQWTPVATNLLSANGNFTLTATNAVDRGAARQFYILQVQ
jgi:hypothetical protein